MAVKSIAAVLIIFLSAAAALAAQAMSWIEDEGVSGKDNVLVASLQGTIEEGTGMMMGPNINPRNVRQVLDYAEQEKGIEAVVLRINSPGGSIAASQHISDLIREYEKPVVISMGDIAVSGGYYISAPSDAIVAHPGSQTGSIGVISTFINLEEFLEDLGLEVETIKSGEHKDMFSRSLTDEEREFMQELSDEAYRQFKEEIAAERNMDIEEVREVATGEIFLGSQAKELGLVDKLGGEETAVEKAAELAGIEDPAVEYYGDKSLFDIIFSPSFNISSWIEKVLLPEEIITIEKIREGGEPELRYEVR